MNSARKAQIIPFHDFSWQSLRTLLDRNNKTRHGQSTLLDTFGKFIYLCIGIEKSVEYVQSSQKEDYK